MKVAIATDALRLPIPDDDAIFRDALIRRGAQVDPIIWSDVADLSGYACCVIRSTWDYQEHGDALLSWAHRAAQSTRLHNAYPIIEWNFHKRYLLELAHRGIAIVPTHLVPADSEANLHAVAASFGCRRIVVKPAVSGGSWNTKAFACDDAGLHDAMLHLATIAASGDALVQPFLEEARHGEKAVVFIAGRYSHAFWRYSTVDTTSDPGDERLAEVEDDELSTARAALACAPGEALYARVDLVRVAGVPAVMECELIEPSLAFALAPESAERMADAVIGSFVAS